MSRAKQNDLRQTLMQIALAPQNKDLRALETRQIQRARQGLGPVHENEADGDATDPRFTFFLEGLS